MATPSYRSRASTVPYSEAEAAELGGYLGNLIFTTTEIDEPQLVQQTYASIKASHCIRQLFRDNSNPNRTRDAFRHLNGFQKTLSSLQGASNCLRQHQYKTDTINTIAEYCQSLLGLLSGALQDHWGNCKYFRKRIDEGGWYALTRILKEILQSLDTEHKIGFTEKVLGALFACALEDDTLNDLFSGLRRQIKSHEERHTDSDMVAAQNPYQSVQTARASPFVVQTARVSPFVEDVIKKTLGQQAFVHNPKAILVAIELWLATSKATDLEPSHTALYLVPSVVNCVASLSAHCLIALHDAGLLQVILPTLVDPQFANHYVERMRTLASALLTFGVTDLRDAYFLYHNASVSPIVAEILQLTLKGPNIPPCFHFDLSLHGFASIELSDIGRSFPPLTSSAGYTLSLWLQVVSFDPESHTTLFGAFDSSQTCFVLVYLEKDTQNLILQTSVTASRPSVRFKSFTFKAGRWYHLCLVHRRPKTTSSSKASLFVDGEFVESVKSQYPASPLLAGPSSHPPDLPNVSHKYKPVQAFLGTPQDLASKIGRNAVSSQWRLASAYLFNDTLSDDLIAVHKQLGPRYHGNYQDCLGSFQTYETSAALNLRNESLHPGKEEKSEIIAAIRSKASQLLPEARIILNFSPMMVLDDDDENHVDESQLVKALSKSAVKNLRTITRGGRTVIVVNGAVPSINEALLNSHGFAVLTGEPAVVIPQSLDEAAWRIGGCAPVGLSLVESARTCEDLVRALDILLGSVEDSWRNSEAMERENGFGVLASLLTAKLDSVHAGPNMQCLHGGISIKEREELTMKVFCRILKFIGYEESNPADSVINNPLAYRILVVDLEVWRSSSPEVQKLYYEQFSTFGTGSKHRLFNSKRLARMRILKKWLDALKTETFYVDTFDDFLDAFQALLKLNPSADILRSLALFITYAVHTPKESTSQLLRAARSVRRPQQTLGTPPRRATTWSVSPSPNNNHPGQRALTRAELGLKVLEMYSAILCQKDTSNIKKFARTVTNKWLLHLLADEIPAVVVLANKIIARVLVINGSSYVNKFTDKTGGFVIMRHRLKRWWQVKPLWISCFAVLFGEDVAAIDFDRPFDLYSLLATFAPNAKIVNPQILPVLTAMLQNGLKSITKDQSDPDSPLIERTASSSSTRASNEAFSLEARKRSHSLRSDPNVTSESNPDAQRLAESVRILHTVTRFLADMQSSNQLYRDFTLSSSYVQELLYLLFPVIVSSDIVSADTELHYRDSSLTFNGNDVIIRPLSQMSIKAAPIVRTTSIEALPALKASRAQPLKRGSSYVLVTSEQSEYQPSTARLQSVVSPKAKLLAPLNVSNSLVEEILEILIAVFADQILSRKEFQGIGLFMKVPPGFQEHQAYFETFILRNTVSSLGNTIKLDQKLLWEPRVLTNLARFATHLCEAVYEGWFIDGADTVLDFLCGLLEYLQRPDIKQIKSVRLCSEVISSVRIVVSRIVLLRLSESDESQAEPNTIVFLNKITYWQTVLFSPQSTQEEFLRLLCYLLYTKLMSPHASVRDVAANIWRTLLVQRPEEAAGVLYRMVNAENKNLTRGFQKILELDNGSFLNWIDDHRTELDAIFFGDLATVWEDFVTAENRRTEDSAKARVAKRREKLKVWVSEELSQEDVIRRHEISSDHWRSNIYASEHLKRQRSIQDQADALAFNLSSWKTMLSQLHRPNGVLDDGLAPRWQLDQTEGRNRMRLRLIPDKNARLTEYQAKGSSSKNGKPVRPLLDVRDKTIRRSASPIAPSPIAPGDSEDRDLIDSVVTPASTSTSIAKTENDDDFEMVDEPAEGNEDYEDKNRKVMRSLQRGEQVEHVHNVSRIIGLEARGGLLITAKKALYILDDFFQRSDGEIVDAWQAPPEERDSYMQMISGREVGDLYLRPTNSDHDTRWWLWEDVLSISKRRFLFRDVAIEIFFVDGRSYLLTVITPELRDTLYQILQSKAQNATIGSSRTNLEDLWRVESLRTIEDQPQSLGSRFTNVFSQSLSNPATKKWVKGEMSNFHYLMLVNTMAGRTFNDLTQYPVFPWVLADYTSEELDLTNPRSFRDLTKPMGCQHPARQAEFQERYRSFAEMGDSNSPPFHYGTHYSSAMIVTSYLIRMEPFVQSYLLLQGGSFDHPDRLFYSVERAWTSASRDNMTDVRELTPEFYYLPDFLLNSNGYDFGSRQGHGGKVDTVQLPPWAKGDPKIFIAKHREALESEYVSKHLHHWIDLVFGHKQRGEAALEATNVFHHLSYRGAKNLDEIDDPVERLATIGIIHNFGQTPHQVFQRLHPQREDRKHRQRRLDTLADNLTRLPFPLLSESQDKVSSLLYSTKQDRLLCSGGFRLNMPPNCDKYMEWGYIDGSVRFYAAESKKLIGLFEHIHQGQLSSAMFVDSRNLVTAGTDCTVSVWQVVNSAKSVDLNPKACLFGHRAAVTVLAASRSFSTLLSASSDGEVILWDLNRLDLVRIMTKGNVVECAAINNVTGTIALCRGPEISLFTLNGDLLLEKHICAEGDETITACAFYEGAGNEWMQTNLVLTGHRRGVVNIWNLMVHEGRFHLDHVKRMNHMDPAGFNFAASITAILPMPSLVYTGDEDGRVFEWDCIQRA